ncbi:MAG: hypothetical protein O8C62_04655 [Candidatus Methanoperedens sp.]|nr:hypothetical protein [Candidatus Methanoperedens sp.]
MSLQHLTGIKIPHGVDADEIIAQVVRGKAVDAAILELTKKETKAPEVAQVPLIKDEESLHSRELIRKYEESIGEMKKYQDELKIELDTKDEELRKLGEFIEKQRSEAYKQFKKEKIIRVRDKEVAHLRKRISENNKKISYLNERIHRLKHIRRLEISGRALPVKIISAFTKDSILKTQEEVGIKKDDLILLKDASGGGSITAKMLSDLGVRAIIICNDMSHAAEEELFNLGMPVLKAKDVNIQFDPAEELAVINPDDIKNAIEEWNRKAEQRKIAAKEEWLKSLVDEYRSERRREVKG